MAGSELKRRRFLSAAGRVSAAAIAAPWVITQSKAATQLVFAGFGGDYQKGQTKALFDPFEKETGIRIVQTTGVDLAKLRAQVQSGNVEWDFIALPDRLRYTAVRDELVMPLDYSVIDTRRIVPSLVTSHAVGCVTIPMLLAYSTQVYPGGEKASGASTTDPSTRWSSR